MLGVMDTRPCLHEILHEKQMTIKFSSLLAGPFVFTRLFAHHSTLRMQSNIKNPRLSVSVSVCLCVCIHMRGAAKEPAGIFGSRKKRKKRELPKLKILFLFLCTHLNTLASSCEQTYIIHVHTCIYEGTRTGTHDAVQLHYKHRGVKSASQIIWDLNSSLQTRVSFVSETELKPELKSHAALIPISRLVR